MYRAMGFEPYRDGSCLASQKEMPGWGSASAVRRRLEAFLRLACFEARLSAGRANVMIFVHALMKSRLLYRLPEAVDNSN
jgi:hypothetical protein